MYLFRKTSDYLDMMKEFDNMLQDRLEDAKQIKKAKVTDFLQERWEGFRPATDEDFDFSPNTGYPKKELVALGHKVATLPEGKNTSER